MTNEERNKVERIAFRLWPDEAPIGIKRKYWPREWHSRVWRLYDVLVSEELL